MAYNNGYNNKPYGNKNYAQNNNWEKQELPENYLKGGYYEEKDGETVLKKEYIIGFPNEIAKLLSDEKNKNNKNKNKRSQIRKFYEYVLRIQDLLKRKKTGFSVVEAELARLVPYVKYAESRSTVTELFRMFVEENVKHIHDEKDLTAFVKHFEAIVAYLPKERN